MKQLINKTNWKSLDSHFLGKDLVSKPARDVETRQGWGGPWRPGRAEQQDCSAYPCTCEQVCRTQRCNNHSYLPHDVSCRSTFLDFLQQYLFLLHFFIYRQFAIRNQNYGAMSGAPCTPSPKSPPLPFTSSLASSSNIQTCIRALGNIYSVI